MIAFLSLAAAALPARADDVKKECVDAATVGQTKRDEGKLLAARDQMLRCSREECTVVKAFCARWLTEIEAQIPSVVVRVTDADGSDRTDAKATMDGRAVRLDGKPLSLDPGEHTLVVEAPESPRKEQKVLLVDREKSRLLNVQMPTKKKAQAMAEAHPSASPQGKGGIPSGVWIVGGLGVAALGNGAFFGYLAKKELNHLQDDCSPNCDNSRTKPGRTDALIADISFGVGAAAIIGAIIWAAASPPSTEGASRKASLPRVDVAPVQSGFYATTSISY
jgi:hypothetical protein